MFSKAEAMALITWVMFVLVVFTWATGAVIGPEEFAGGTAFFALAALFFRFKGV